MSAIAGRVLILPKGEYDASTMYEFLDLVNHNSSSWLAKKASTGIEPSDANSEFWQKFGSSVTPDGVTIVIDENGVISAVGGTADKVTYENESVEDVTNVKEALDMIFEGGIDVDVSALTTNLLNATLETTESNGVTCTNNGDGTYTLNGTAEQETNFMLQQNLPASDVPVKLIGCPVGGGATTYALYVTNFGGDGADKGNGSIRIEPLPSGYSANIVVRSGVVCNNLVFKPMLTTNLEATYDDFVSYTGNTGKLNEDVAEIRKTYFSPHNKPTGTYTGNGSATNRTINVGGVSKVLMIQNSINGNALVDEYGALLLPLVGDIQRLSRGECNFKNGVLTMATENVVVNRNGSEFDYHSL